MKSRSVYVVAAAAVLFSCSLLLYLPALNFDFIRYDDPSYVYLHPRISHGFSADNARWSLTAFEVGNWHPLTLMSHMLDVSLFGLRPGAHHMVNAVFHATAVSLLFVLVAAATRRIGAAAVAAALFAIHPLNVESVAWISQRKSVLAMVLLLFAMNVYVDWVRRGGVVRYATALAAFAAALAAKPMVVVAPGLLLALDVWPLGRLSGDGVAARLRCAGRLVLEKVPWVALAVASSVVTVIAQRAGGAMSDTNEYGVAASAAHAVFAYGWYLYRMVWPADLSLFYPMSLGDSGWRVVLSASLGLVCLIVIAAVGRRRAPYVGFAVAWYAIALLPVAGLIPFGTQIVADRYAYLSLIGPFIAIGCAAADLWARSWTPMRGVAYVGAAAVAIALIAGQQSALAHWRDSERILGQGVRRAPDNPHALTNLGILMVAEARYVEAIALLERAKTIVPRFRLIHVKLGYAYAQEGRLTEARAEYEEALRLEANDPTVLLELAAVLAGLGNQAAAQARLKEAESLLPR